MPRKGQKLCDVYTILAGKKQYHPNKYDKKMICLLEQSRIREVKYKEDSKINVCIQKRQAFWKTSKHRGCFECKQVKQKLKKKLQGLFQHLALILKPKKSHKNLMPKKVLVCITIELHNTSNKQDKPTSTKTKKNGASNPCFEYTIPHYAIPIKFDKNIKHKTWKAK